MFNRIRLGALNPEDGTVRSLALLVHGHSEVFGEGGKRRLPSWYSSWLFLEENHGTCLQGPPAGLESSVLWGSVLRSHEEARRVVTFPLLPVNVVTSRKHKSQNVAGWRTTKHLA